jgi:hypothetical protein
MEASGTISARRVFGKPYAKNGVVVIPVARIDGGGRRGRRHNGPAAALPGAVSGQPVGAYVIRGEKVRWKPAIDVNALLFRAQMIAAAAAIIALARRRR